MTVSIPALIADLRVFAKSYRMDLKNPAVVAVVIDAADALESLSAPPASDDERIARVMAYVTPLGHTQALSLVAAARMLEEASIARLSPVTREALDWDGIASDVGYPTSPDDSYGPESDEFVAGRAAGYNAAFENVRAAVMSRFALPEPAEAVTREALALVAEAIRRNCTPSAEAYDIGGDFLIQAVADWVENPPEWVTALRSLPEPAEVERSRLSPRVIEVTDEMVRAVSASLFTFDSDYKRARVRAALTAALGGGDHVE